MPAPRKPIDRRRLPAAITAARDTNHPNAIALQGGDARKTIDDTLAAAILLRIVAGIPVKQCAEDFGVSAGAIYQRVLDDPEGFGAKYEVAKRIKSHVMKDTVLEVAYDPNRTAADKAVIIDALKWTAKIDNRSDFGDKLQVDQRTVTINMPDWTNDV